MGANLREENLGDGGKYVGVVANKLAPNSKKKKPWPRLKNIIAKKDQAKLFSSGLCPQM